MERSKSLSIKSVKAYKIFTVLCISILIMAYIFVLSSGSGDKQWVDWLFMTAYLLIAIFVWVPQMKKFFRKIKEISYDKENLYVKEGEYEIQIPFYEIKDIEITSLDGLYTFRLYRDNQFGKEVICKPSLWHPLNYKRIDAELNRIRSYMYKAHREYQEKMNSKNALPSNIL